MIIILSEVIVMGKQTVSTTETTKSRRRKTGGNSGYKQCNMCHGTGRIKKK